MKKLSAVCCLFSVLILLGGCSNEEENQAFYDHPPVGVLVSQDHRITIHTGPDGPLYSVIGPDGKQLAKEISREELQASFPNLNVSEIWAEASSTLHSIEKTVEIEGGDPVEPGGFRPIRMIPSKD